MELFREWSKKVEEAVDEVVKEVDATTSSPQQPVQTTKVVSRIDIKTAERSELVQFIKDQNLHLTRLQTANKKCEQRIVQLEDQKLQHLELINSLNEEAKQTNDDLKQAMENSRKFTQENQLQRLLNEKLAAEMQNLKNLLDASKREVEELKVKLANDFESSQPTDVPFGGYGSYGSFSANANQEIFREKRRRSKKSKKQQRLSAVESNSPRSIANQADEPSPISPLVQPSPQLELTPCADQQQLLNSDELVEVDLLASTPSNEPTVTSSPRPSANSEAEHEAKSQDVLCPSPIDSSSACSSESSSSSTEDEQQPRQMSYRKYTETVNLKMLKLADEIRHLKQHNQQQVTEHQAQQQKLQLQLIESSNAIMHLESLKKKEKQSRDELDAKISQLTAQINETNEEFSSYRRRAQALIEQNQMSYQVEGADISSPVEEKGLFVERLKELEQENSNLLAQLEDEKMAGKNKLSLLEQKNEKLNDKLSKALAEIRDLVIDASTSKAASENSMQQLKLSLEKQLSLDAKKHQDSYAQLEEKLSAFRHNSLNQLGERDEKIARLKDTVDVKTEEILKLEKERDKAKDDFERMNTFPQFNSKIVVPVPHVDQLLSSKNDAKTKESTEDNFLSFVGSQAKKEKELVQAQEMLEHYKNLQGETEAQNNLLMLQLSALKQEIRKFDKTNSSSLNVDQVKNTFINYLCSNNSPELYNQLASQLNMTEAEKLSIVNARKQMNSWRLW